MKKVLPFLLILALVLCCGCGKAQPRDTKTIITEIIDTYSATPDASLEKLFTELKTRDENKAQLWTQILDFWKSADKATINENALPENLPGDDSLCLVILGFELNADGTMQDELIGRLQVALQCAGQYPNACVLCTGGGTAANNPDVTEAGLMADWMLEHGLDESRLLIENRSTTTMENALYSYDILQREQPQVRSLAIITSSYHIVWGSVLYESVLLMTNGESAEEQIHVVSNAAYPFSNEKYADARGYLTMQLKSLLS